MDKQSFKSIIGNLFTSLCRPSRDDWHLTWMRCLSYNSTHITATGYAPAYLLRVYSSNCSTILHSPNAINRPFEKPSQTKTTCGACSGGMSTEFKTGSYWKWLNNSLPSATERTKALVWGQHFQKRAYNKETRV